MSSLYNELRSLFKPLCGKEPVIFVRKPAKRTGKIYSSIAFNVQSTLYNLPCLNEFQTLFYQNSGKLHSNGYVCFIKIVPSNNERSSLKFINSYIPGTLGNGR